MFTAFITAKGSIYNVLNEGRTKRWKKVTREHFEESTKTVYLQPNVAEILGISIYFGAWVSMRGTELWFVMRGQMDQLIEYELEPRVGLCPLELWGDLSNPNSLHVGNPIVVAWWS